jgi:hypothetical protein
MSREAVEFAELQESVTVTLKTKCPEKYLLVDRQTGDVFVAKDTGEWELVRGGPHRHV